MFRNKLTWVSLITIALIAANMFAAVSAFTTIQFKSEATGNVDSYAFAKPFVSQPGVPGTLIVYLHGLGQDYKEPFSVALGTATIADAIMMEEASVGILSCNYGGASWGKESAINDISNNIREVMKTFPAFRVVIYGTSMGAGTAINYACVAPDDIKDKITGVLAVYPSGDMKDLLSQTRNTKVRDSLIAAFGRPGGTNTKSWESASFLHNLDQLSKTVKVCIISSKEDILVPPICQKVAVKAIKKNGNKIKFIEIPGNHGVPPRTVLLTALSYALHPGIK